MPEIGAKAQAYLGHDEGLSAKISATESCPQGLAARWRQQFDGPAGQERSCVDSVAARLFMSSIAAFFAGTHFSIAFQRSPCRGASRQLPLAG